MNFPRLSVRWATPQTRSAGGRCQKLRARRSLFDVLNHFQTGRTHIAFVCAAPHLARLSVACGGLGALRCGPDAWRHSAARVLGMVTLEVTMRECHNRPEKSRGVLRMVALEVQGT